MRTVTRVSERATHLVLAGVFALCLIAGSPTRIVGDGGEYMVQALNFAQLNPPPLGRRALASIQPRIVELAPELAGWDIEASAVRAPDRTHDFLHFWFYALLATPGIWLTMVLGISPLHAFTLLNVTLAGLALWVALPRIGPSVAVLLFAGPFIWWIDKGHTEVFTVALLTIAIVTMRDRPWWALVAAGAASTQNPPITIVLLLILGVEVVRRRAAILSDRRLVAGAAAGLMLAGLQPVYTYLRHGTPSLLLYATRPGVPTWGEASAAVLDPSMGLVGNYPLFLGGCIVCAVWIAWKHPRAWLAPEMIVAAASSVAFLYSFAQTTNAHHGATPSLTRYALWLVPLSIPLWTATRASVGTAGRRAIATTAVVSGLVSLFAFHPRVPDNSREPTWLATWLWTQHPTWQQPLPEVFAEVHRDREGLIVPVATAGCEKVLLAGASAGAGTWPFPCLPAPLPDECQAAGAMCYANRQGDTYTFVRTPGRELAPGAVTEPVWPRAAEDTVRRVYLEHGWGRMADAPAQIIALRAQHGVRVAPYGNDEGFILVLRPEAPHPVLHFRSSAVLEGEITDATTGAVLERLAFTGPADALWEVPIPTGRDGLVLLTMTRRAPIE